MNSPIAIALAAVLAAPAALAQTCNAHIRPGAPEGRYVVNAIKGIVLDRQTGLTWKRCVEGQSGSYCEIGSPSYFLWMGALKEAYISTHAGYGDWRVPNLKELESLVEAACIDPAINSSVFPNDPSNVLWTSSPTIGYGAAYTVDFNDGYTSDGRHWKYSVRLVRGGQ